MKLHILPAFLAGLVFTAALAGCAEKVPEAQTGSGETSSAVLSEAVSSAPVSSSETGASPQADTPAPPAVVTVTFPEGLTFPEVADLLEKNKVCTAREFYTASQSYTVQSFTVPEDENRCYKMEGFLFPDTYQFYEGEGAENALRKMLNNYAAKSGMPTQEELILASIIQQETRSASHMQMVSSVYHNRLDINMKMQSDPTREYINDHVTGSPLLGDTAKYAALYNTYKCKALPAGPICNPGRQAIEAAKNPAESDYLFFFFGKDNDNHYAKTFAEHEELMEKYGVQYE